MQCSEKVIVGEVFSLSCYKHLSILENTSSVYCVQYREQVPTWSGWRGLETSATTSPGSSWWSAAMLERSWSCTTTQYSAVQYSTVQYIIVQLVLQYNTVQCSEVQYSTVKYSTVQYSTAGPPAQRAGSNHPTIFLFSKLSFTFHSHNQQNYTTIK